jgi:hypothetical protein
MSKHDPITAGDALKKAFEYQQKRKKDTEAVDALFAEFREKAAAYPHAQNSYGKTNMLFSTYGDSSYTARNIAGAFRAINICVEEGKLKTHVKAAGDELQKMITERLTLMGYNVIQCGNDCDLLHISWAPEIEDDGSRLRSDTEAVHADDAERSCADTD